MGLTTSSGTGAVLLGERVKTRATPSLRECDVWTWEREGGEGRGGEGRGRERGREMRKTEERGITHKREDRT